VCTCAASVYYHSLFRWTGLKRDCRFIIFTSIHWVSTESSLEWKSFKLKKNYTHAHAHTHTHTHFVCYVFYTSRAAKIVVRLHTHVHRKSSQKCSEFVNFPTSLTHTNTLCDLQRLAYLQFTVCKYSLFTRYYPVGVHMVHTRIQHNNNMCEPFSYSTRVGLLPSLRGHNTLYYNIQYGCFFFHRIIISNNIPSR